MPLGNYTGPDPSAQPQQQAVVPSVSDPKNKFFSGGFVSDVFDVLNAGQYATAGIGRKLLGLEPGKGFLQVAKEGVQNRASWVDTIKEKTPYESSTSVAKNFMQEFIRTGAGITLDILLDPTLVLGKIGLVKKGTGAVKSVAANLGSQVLESSPKIASLVEKVSPWVVRPSKLLPEFYTEEKTTLKAMNAMTAAEIGKTDQFLTVQKMTKAEQIRLAQVMEGGITTKTDLQAMAKRFSEEFDRVGAALSKENPDLLSDLTLAKNKGTYLRRLIKDYETGEEASKFGYRKVKIQGDTFKARKLTQEEYIARGGIQEAQPRIIRGLFEETKDLNTAKFYNRLAARVAEEVPQSPGAGRVFLDPAEYSKAEVGDLAGKFVPQRILDDLEAVNDTFTSPMMKQYIRGLQYWKVGKTALNPATITRNGMTNFLFQAPLAGVAPWRLDVYWNWMKEVKTNSALYNQARFMGLEGTTYSSTELMGKVKSFYADNPSLVRKAFGSVQKGIDYASNFYGSVDKFFKGAAFYKGVQDGLTPLESMRRAQFYFVDYSDVPKAIDALRKSPIGAPFVSFQYGISLPIAKTLLERPDKLAAYSKIMRGLQKINLDGRTEEQIEKEEGALPGYVKGQRETFVRLPWKDGTGKSQYLDMGYILPLGQNFSGFAPFQGPAITLGNDLVKNYNSFLGKPIWDGKDSLGEKTTKIVGYTLQNLLPNNPLVPGSFNYAKWSQIGIVPRITEGKIVLEATKDKKGNEDEAVRTLLNTILGIKIQPFDISKEFIQRIKEKKADITDLKSEITRIQKNESLYDFEKQRKIQKLRDRIKERRSTP